MATPPHKSLRVLFVDDEKPLQEFMRSELPRLGHEVTVCPDGKAALKATPVRDLDAPSAAAGRYRVIQRAPRDRAHARRRNFAQRNASAAANPRPPSLG